MSEQTENTVFVNTESVYSIIPLSDLLKIACSEQVPFFEVNTGEYMKKWHKIKSGDKIVYSIDRHTICQGNITFIQKKVYRPRNGIEHELYACFADFARTYCSDIFDKFWYEEMMKKHKQAISRQRWLFVCFAVMQPNLNYHTNIEFLKAKVKQMEEAEEEARRFVMCPLSD